LKNIGCKTTFNLTVSPIAFGLEITEQLLFKICEYFAALDVFFIYLLVELIDFIMENI
jgi:hypothetical protein